ncbi:MAG: hypothetical protein JO250_19030 [Armatimonadetes bacterium]|nr:hypothetical protein [Armatimonadota bacterium]
MSRGWKAIIALLSLASVPLGLAGCGQHQSPSSSPLSATPLVAGSPALPPAAAPTTTPFQPYALVNQPPPKPPVVTHRHRVLHLTRRGRQVYLADSDGHYYHVGRDRRGRIFPTYTDPATHAVYPLYYDSARDRLYRLARSDDGHFYRGYVDDPANRFYRDDWDYERVTAGGRPVVSNSYNTYNENIYNYGPGYPYPRGYNVTEGTYFPPPPYPYVVPPAHYGSHHNDNWLWAIPVIIGAYLLLRPHHYSPPPVRSTTVIVQQRNTIINSSSSSVFVPGYGRGEPPPPRPLAPRVRPATTFRAPLAPMAAVPAAIALRKASAIHPVAHPLPAARPLALTHPHVMTNRQTHAMAFHRPRPVIHPRPAVIVPAQRAASHPAYRMERPRLAAHFVRSRPAPSHVEARPVSRPARVVAPPIPRRPLIRPVADARPLPPPVRRLRPSPPPRREVVRTQPVVYPRPMVHPRPEARPHLVSRPRPAFKPMPKPAPRLAARPVARSVPRPRVRERPAVKPGKPGAPRH